MRIRCVIALAFAAPAATAVAHAAPPALERAFDTPDAIVVADRGGKAKSRGADWRRAPDWARRTLDPRALERATRDALRRLDPTDPQPTWSPERSSVPAEPEPEPVAEAREPAPVAEPDLDPAPAWEAEPPAQAARADTPMITLTPGRSHDAVLAPLAVGAIALGLSVLAGVWLAARRRVAPPIGEPLLALPAPAADPHARTTRPRSVIDAAVATAVASTPVEAVPFPGGGRYEIVEEIGRGGMGVVYKARDKRLDRVVALKRLPDTLESEPRYVELLLREARSAARLNHRNIVTVHDVDRENGAWFITMELLEGSTVETLLRERGRIAPRSVVWLADQVLAGLGYAHERGIVHRDVKPANLFVTRDRTAKLMDFGVAKILEEARRKRTLIGGTPAYMAPEQATGGTIDGRADLYALGATCYELLTGELVFADGDALHHHRATQPLDPRERAQGIPDELALLVLALLRKQPDERPASASEVAASLRKIAATLQAARSAA